MSKAARRYGALVVLGGAGFADEVVRRRFPDGFYATDFKRLEEVAISLASAAQSLPTKRQGSD
jgi:hypothetical protein